MNIIDIVILVVIGVSTLYGMYRGFISGVLSMAGLICSAALAFAVSPQLSAWLQGNETLVETLMYYTDAGSRIADLDLSMLAVSQVSQSALSQILQSAKLPAAFESAFVAELSGAQGTLTVSSLLSQTIVGVSISILSFLICFLVSFVVVSFVIHLIQYVFELPVLRHLDSLMGGVFGLLRGVLLMFILFALVPIVLAVAPVDILQTLIDESQLAPLFDSQLILSIVQGGL